MKRTRLEVAIRDRKFPGEIQRRDIDAYDHGSGLYVHRSLEPAKGWVVAHHSGWAVAYDPKGPRAPLEHRTRKEAQDFADALTSLANWREPAEVLTEGDLGDRVRELAKHWRGEGNDS